MEGYTGILLRANLTDCTITKESINEELIREFGGGRGVNSKILYDEVQPGTDPLGPDNKIIISAGPCNGTIVPGSCRFTVSSKSPMTGLLGDSNAGAFFGAGIKYAGYDVIIIEGQSDKPVYLWIDDDKVELRLADHLWGETIGYTTRTIQRENFDPDIFVISIGCAGENLVRFANLITDLGRALGRTGLGAVFGSKKLKAVAVRGSKGVKVAHPDLLKEAVRGMNEAWIAPPDKNNRSINTLDLRARYGPAAAWTHYEKFGMFPTKNYQGGASWKLNWETLGNYFVKQKACFSCPAGCNHMFVMTDGPYAGTYGEGIESLLFAPKLGSEDMDLMVKLHSLLDEYGMDYFETTNLISFAMECFEKGILTKEDTDGLELTWGSAGAVIGLTEKIAKKEGFGVVLAEGLKRASKAIGRGSEEFAIQAKGQALVARDPRACKGWGLAYAVASRGPCHVRAILPEPFPADTWDASVQKIISKYNDPTNPLSEEGKGELVKWYEDLTAFKNCMEICLFIMYPWNVPFSSQPRMLAKLYHLVTGIGIDEDEVLQIGERIVNLERAFNVREGLTRRDDTLPKRFLKEPYPNGPAKGQVVKLEPMINEYYEFRGWNKATGFPTREKLCEINLDYVANELESIGKLAI